LLLIFGHAERITQHRGRNTDNADTDPLTFDLLASVIFQVRSRDGAARQKQ